MSVKNNPSIVCYKYKRANRDTLEYYFTINNDATVIRNEPKLTATITNNGTGNFQIKLNRNYGIDQYDLKINNTSYIGTTISQLDSQKTKYCAIFTTQYNEVIFGGPEDILFESTTQLSYPIVTNDVARLYDRDKIYYRLYTISGSGVSPAKLNFGNTFKLVVSAYQAKHEVFVV